ncbi:hypothetical protein [Peptoclostridium litorale]|uniref:hypothetical protein n=1 Tax=Peptoclostridium litorale TaxID=1557 RepID=UPI000A95132E|nr:hypothetical protein [Peptoclostridium litorale]
MNKKCPTCGYQITDIRTLKCPRCSTDLKELFKCSGNCKKCSVHSGVSGCKSVK